MRGTACSMNFNRRTWDFERTVVIYLKLESYRDDTFRIFDNRFRIFEKGRFQSKEKGRSWHHGHRAIQLATLKACNPTTTTTSALNSAAGASLISLLSSVFELHVLSYQHNYYHPLPPFQFSHEAAVARPRTSHHWNRLELCLMIPWFLPLVVLSPPSHCSPLDHPYRIMRC